MSNIYYQSAQYKDAWRKFVEKDTDQSMGVSTEELINDKDQEFFRAGDAPENGGNNNGQTEFWEYLQALGNQQRLQLDSIDPDLEKTITETKQQYKNTKDEQHKTASFILAQLGIDTNKIEPLLLKRFTFITHDLNISEERRPFLFSTLLPNFMEKLKNILPAVSPENLIETSITLLHAIEPQDINPKPEDAQRCLQTITLLPQVITDIQSKLKIPADQAIQITETIMQAATRSPKYFPDNWALAAANLVQTIAKESTTITELANTIENTTAAFSSSELENLTVISTTFTDKKNLTVLIQSLQNNLSAQLTKLSQGKSSAVENTIDAIWRLVPQAITSLQNKGFSGNTIIALLSKSVTAHYDHLDISVLASLVDIPVDETYSYSLTRDPGLIIIFKQLQKQNPHTTWNDAQNFAQMVQDNGTENWLDWYKNADKVMAAAEKNGIDIARGSPTAKYNLLMAINPQRFSETMYTEIMKNRLALLTHTDQDNRPVAVVVYPKSDWNGGFAGDQNTFQDMYDQGYRIVYYELGEKTELVPALQQCVGQDQHKADLLIIGGHGTQNTTQLGFTEGDRYRFDTEDSGQFGDLSQYATPAMQGISLSCSTFAGGDTASNMVRFWENEFNRDFDGPAYPSSIENITWGKDTQGIARIQKLTWRKYD